jgi:RNA polymerase sigma-70 factor (ECF subfamily)
MAEVHEQAVEIQPQQLAENICKVFNILNPESLRNSQIDQLRELYEYIVPDSRANKELIDYVISEIYGDVKKNSRPLGLIYRALKEVSRRIRKGPLTGHLDQHIHHELHTLHTQNTLYRSGDPFARIDDGENEQYYTESERFNIPESSVLSYDEKVRLLTAFKRMPPSQRLSLALRTYEPDLSNEEISLIVTSVIPDLETTLGATKSRIKRGRDSLSAAYQQLPEADAPGDETETTVGKPRTVPHYDFESHDILDHVIASLRNDVPNFRPEMVDEFLRKKKLYGEISSARATAALPEISIPAASESPSDEEKEFQAVEAELEQLLEGANETSTKSTDELLYELNDFFSDNYPMLLNYVKGRMGIVARGGVSYDDIVQDLYERIFRGVKDGRYHFNHVRGYVMSTLRGLISTFFCHQAVLWRWFNPRLVDNTRDNNTSAEDKALAAMEPKSAEDLAEDSNVWVLPLSERIAPSVETTQQQAPLSTGKPKGRARSFSPAILRNLERFSQDESEISQTSEPEPQPAVTIPKRETQARTSTPKRTRRPKVPQEVPLATNPGLLELIDEINQTSEAAPVLEKPISKFVMPESVLTESPEVTQLRALRKKNPDLFERQPIKLLPKLDHLYAVPNDTPVLGPEPAPTIQLEHETTSHVQALRVRMADLFEPRQIKLLPLLDHLYEAPAQETVIDAPPALTVAITPEAQVEVLGPEVSFSQLAELADGAPAVPDKQKTENKKKVTDTVRRKKTNTTRKAAAGKTIPTSRQRLERDSEIPADAVEVPQQSDEQSRTALEPTPAPANSALEGEIVDPSDFAAYDAKYGFDASEVRDILSDEKVKPDEKALVKQLEVRAASFDERALEELYDRYEARIYSYIYRRTGNESLAEELTAEVFLKMLEAIRADKAWHSSFSGWLYRIAHNRVIDYYRQRDRQQQVELEDSLITDRHEHNPVAMAAASYDALKLRKAISRLTEEQAEIITLQYLEGYSISEMAEMLNKTEGSIKALRHRGIQSLRQFLEEDDFEY